MDTWVLLEKELKYYGIELINHRKCRICENGEKTVRGVIRTIRDVNQSVKKKKQILLLLWDEVVDILLEQNLKNNNIVDDKLVNLFLFSLKDMVKFLLCFENAEKSKYYQVISSCLNRDIKSFDRQQICKIPDYKISIDWVSRIINRLLYISKLLAFASMGHKRISKYKIKTARGISGPFAHLDLPMEERVFPFGEEVQDRERVKQKQRRYQRGLENYNNDGRVGEGYYWRELRNEPFSWFDRNFEDPYPSRYLLSR
jgi:hypothetical protein